MNGYRVTGRNGELGAYAADSVAEARAKAAAAHQGERTEDMTAEEIGPVHVSNCGRLFVLPRYGMPSRADGDSYGYDREKADVGSIMFVGSNYKHNQGLVIVTKANSQRLTTTDLNGKGERVWARKSGREWGSGDNAWNVTSLSTAVPTILPGRAKKAARLDPGDVLESGAVVRAVGSLGDVRAQEGVGVALRRGRIVVETDYGELSVYSGDDLVALAAVKS